MSITTLQDLLNCQQIDYLVDLYKDQHGPWPIKYFANSDTFKRCFYRHLNKLSTTK